MKKKELFKKQKLVLGLGMEFDEVANIFSEETLSSMSMSHAIGGENPTNANSFVCVGSCINVQCSCSGSQTIYNWVQGAGGCPSIANLWCPSVSVSKVVIPLVP